MNHKTDSPIAALSEVFSGAGIGEYKKQTTYKERVIDGCLICTESLHPPKRFDLDEVQLDDQLICTFVNTVGRLKIHESSGDVYLSSHIVERASNPCDLFDPIAEKIYQH